MAKETDEDVSVQGLPVDADTKEVLENEVKKGKARKFILIYKGAKINKLICFKKGPYNTRIQKAKKDGFRGECVCGIVTGSGVNITFQLAGNAEVADAMKTDRAVDDEPTKITKLKEFLAENELSARKPEYNIVRDVQALAKTEGDDGEGTDGVAPAPAAAPPTSPPSSAGTSSADAELAAKCQQIKAAVLPKIKDAVAADPSKKDEIVRLLETATEHEKESAFGDAFGAFKSLVDTVKTALGGVSDKVKYELLLPGCELRVKTLKDHAQNAVMKTELKKLEDLLKQAKTLAQGGKYGDAVKEFEKLDTEYQVAKKLADGIQQERKFEKSLLIKFNNLKENQGKDVIGAQLKELEGLFQDLDVAIKARDLPKCKLIRVGGDGKGGISGKMEAFRQLALRHGDYVGLRNNALLKVKTLEAHPNKDAIKIDTEAITKVIDKAKEEYETNKKYEKARDLLLTIDKKYTDAKKKADQAAQTAFKKDFDAVQLKVKELEKPEKSNPIVAGEVTAIKAKLKKAGEYAGAKQYPDAVKLLAEAKQETDAAEKLAAEQAAFAAADKAAGDSTRNIDKDSKAAVAAVQKLHDQLKTHPQEPAIQFELGEVQKSIDQAKTALA